MHGPLSFSQRHMRILRPVVQSLVRPMLDIWHRLSPGCSIGKHLSVTMHFGATAASASALPPWCCGGSGRSRRAHTHPGRRAAARCTMPVIACRLPRSIKAASSVAPRVSTTSLLLGSPARNSGESVDRCPVSKTLSPRSRSARAVCDPIEARPPVISIICSSFRVRPVGMPSRGQADWEGLDQIVAAIDAQRLSGRAVALHEIDVGGGNSGGGRNGF